jgi:hypothetical protein
MLSIVSLDNIARALPGDHTIEAALTKWGITALAALLVAVTLLPWFSAHNDYGSAQMTGWGAWTTTGEIDASLRPLPLALLVYLPAGVMIYGALRGAFGAAVVGAMATFVAGLLPFMLKPAVDRHVPAAARWPSTSRRHPSWSSPSHCWRRSSAGSATPAASYAPHHGPTPERGSLGSTP